ncbi:putative Uridine-cytidine kinase 2-B [Blattamonas nauphoetae]|uniref:uridine/cytidine kinase n=1 Tax=Blattamonas nauphoetae TaxID=2049346 RepID=A0ABQ9XEF2_9EUKA|nr:putative Uridine-cytidine kinase 2-B [Blattamonas nauphoetae]
MTQAPPLQSPLASIPGYSISSTTNLLMDNGQIVSVNDIPASREEPIFIAVAGGTASGKTTLCEAVIEYLKKHQIIGPQQHVVIVPQDSFYRNLTPQEAEMAEQSRFNFDHPDAFDFELLRQTLRDLKLNKPVKIPSYDFTTNARREGEYTLVKQADVIILEGILALYDQEINRMMSVKLFVDCDSDMRLARRVQRDTKERGRSIDSIIGQYLTFVKPAYDDIISPTKRHADIVILNGKENKVAVSLICAQIRQVLQERLYRTMSPSPLVGKDKLASPPLLLGGSS